MFKRLIYFVSFVLVLGLVSNASADLVARWKFNNDATDSVGSLNWTLVGGASYSTDAKEDSHSLSLDGTDDQAYQTAVGPLIDPFNTETVVIWFKADTTNGTQVIYDEGGLTEGLAIRINNGNLETAVRHTTVQVTASTSFSGTDWTHVAVTFENGLLTLYMNGAEADSATVTYTQIDSHSNAAGIGARRSQDAFGNGSTGDYFGGLIDDVKVYDHILSSGEIAALAGGYPKAYKPTPADGDEYDKFWIVLGWSAGDSADSHDVYFGDNFADVNAGTGDTLRVRQAERGYLIGAGAPGDPLPGGLVPGATYYWRIDEVEADGTTIYKGDVWSFTVIGQTAFHPSPADGREFVELEPELSWSAGFGAIMHYVYFDDNFADVNDGVGAPSQAITTYTPVPLELGKVYYWRVNESDGIATYKGDVWSFSTRPVIAIYDPNLVGWWKLDDKGTGTVIDFSGYNRDGTFRGAPQYVAGYNGDALEFGGDPDYVNIDGYKGVLRIANDNQHAFTICAWVKTSGNGEIMGWGNSGGRERVDFRVNGGRLRVEHGSGNIRGDTNMNDDEWHHVAAVVPEGAAMKDVIFYLDGEVDDYRTISNPDNLFNITSNNDVKMGRRAHTDGFWYTGTIDDARLYDVALTQDEVNLIMLRPDPLLAWNPSPGDGSTVNIDVARPLSWSAGDLAVQHDVYFGTDVNSVAEADASDTLGIYQGPQSTTTYSPLSLEYDETYYWRIDGVEADEATIHKGQVWSFNVANFIVVDNFEDYNDWPGSRIYETWADGWEIPTNGATIGNPEPLPAGEHIAETSIVHWGQQAMPFFYDNSVAAYSEATVNVANLPVGRDWTRQGVQALSLWFRGYPKFVGSFTEDPAGIYTIIARGADIWGTSDEFHFAWKQLSGTDPWVIIAKVENVRDTHNWAKAGVMIRDTLEPDSAHGMMVVTPASGVAFQRRTVAGGTSTTTTQAGITAPQWVKIERSIAGDVTASYSDDGITWTELGSETINMSAPIYIGLALTSHHTTRSCEATFSNVYITGAVSPQWMDQSIVANNNAAEPMYVAVGSSGVTPVPVYYDDLNATQIGAWTQWSIDLKEFAKEGVRLTDVDKLSIGFDKSNPQAGGSGKMYFDDIRLYRPRCFATLLRPAAGFNNDCVVDYLDLEIIAADWLQRDSVVATSAPNDVGLMAHYRLDGNADDSSGNNYHGIAKGNPSYAAGKYNQALSFDGFDDYVAIQDVNYAGTGYTEVSVCAWIRTSPSTNEKVIASFDRDEYWRLTIGGGESGGPGLVGWHVMTMVGGVETQVDYGSGRRVDDGQWHHVAGTFDNGTSTIYIDGAPETSSFGGPTFGSGLTRYGFLGIGSEATEFNSRPNATGYYEGDLDDVRIYSRALSQAEIAYMADETPEDGEMYIPVTSVANMYDEEPQLSRSVNFKDFAVFADMWLEEQLWPGP